jgi:uncharacterized protein
MHLSRYLRVFPTENPDRFLLFSTLRASSVLVSAATLKAAQSSCVTGAEEETLKRLGMLVDDLAKEREQMRSLLERINSESRRFSAMVVLNLDCNLECGYCYEGEFRGNRYMSEDTAGLLVETLIRDRISAGMDVYLTFYGGEPLLSKDLIQSISLSLLEAAKLHNVEYSFGLITNGTLLDRQTAQRLIPLGLKGAKFTLDGPREIHDRQRPYASGSGSFDTIIENIRAICDIVPIMLGGNFYQENYREFPRLLDHLIDCGITPDKILQVMFTPVTPKAGCAENSSGCSSSNEPWLIEALPFLREEIQSRGFAATKIKPSACIVELADNMVVNLDGSLYKCLALMGWDGYSIGTLADGISDYSQSHCIGNWQRDECLDCSYLPICFGGCRFLNLLQDKGIGELDCKREFLDATLQRMVLQNLKYAKAKAAKTATAKL